MQHFERCHIATLAFIFPVSPGPKEEAERVSVEVLAEAATA